MGWWAGTGIVMFDDQYVRPWRKSGYLPAGAGRGGGGVAGYLELLEREEFLKQERQQELSTYQKLVFSPQSRDDL